MRDVMVNVTLSITFLSVNQTFAIPTSVFLKDDVLFVVGVNLQSGHFYGDLLAKQERGASPM
jgi:hypothetical protein